MKGRGSLRGERFSIMGSQLTKLGTLGRDATQQPKRTILDKGSAESQIHTTSNIYIEAEDRLEIHRVRTPLSDWIEGSWAWDHSYNSWTLAWNELRSLQENYLKSSNMACRGEYGNGDLEAGQRLIRHGQDTVTDTGRESSGCLNYCV